VPVTLESPYNAVRVHLYYLQEGSYRPELAAETIYGVSDSARASRLAIRLKQVLDGRGLFVRMNTIPREADYRDSLSGENYYTLFPNKLPQVYLERIDGRWYYSPETVSRIPELHEGLYPWGADLLLDLLPKVGQSKFVGLKVWQWVGLSILLALAALLHAILSRILNPVVRRLTRSKHFPSLVPTTNIHRIARFISVWIVLKLIHLYLPSLQLPVEASQFAVVVIQIASTVLFALIGWQLIKIVINYSNQFARKTESKMDEQLVPLLERTLQAVIIVAALVHILHVLNINVTALIAGISIGGLALALAAQDTVKNLFGSLTVFLDKPFQIGDWINFGDVHGTVEEVGFRSTRVRTFANSLVYVPNGQLANMTIDNFGLRYYRRFYTKLAITYDTPPALIDKFTKGLRAIVAHHPHTRKDFYEVQLNDFGEHALQIMFYVFLDVGAWSEELKARHEIMLAILALAERLGVRFAFPTSTIRVEDLPGHASLKPTYEKDSAKMDEEIEAFIRDFKGGNGGW